MKEYRFSWFLVGGLLVSTAALCFCGVFPLFLPMPADAALTLRFLCVFAFAAVATFALATSQVAMTAAQHALERRKDFPATFGCAVVCAVICGLVSIGGVHLSWTFLTLGNPHLAAMVGWVDFGGFMLGVVKPLMAFVIEGRKRLDKLEAAEKDAADRALAEKRADADRAAADARAAEAHALTAQALRQARETAEEPVRTPGAPKPAQTSRLPSPPASGRTGQGSGRNTGQGAARVRNAAQTGARTIVRTAAAASAALVPAAAAADAPAIVQHAEIVSRKVSEAEIIAVALGMRQRGATPSFRTIAAELRVPKSRILEAWPKGVPFPGGEAASLAEAG